VTEHARGNRVQREAHTPVRTFALWLVGHAARFLPLLVVAVVVALTWQALRNVQVGATLVHEKRTSNLAGIDYTFTQASLRARIGF